SDLDSNSSRSRMLKVPSPFLGIGAGNVSACTWAPFQSATKRMFSGPNASLDTDFTSAAKAPLATKTAATATSIFEYISNLLWVLKWRLKPRGEYSGLWNSKNSLLTAFRSHRTLVLAKTELSGTL